MSKLFKSEVVTVKRVFELPADLKTLCVYAYAAGSRPICIPFIFIFTFILIYIYICINIYIFLLYTNIIVMSIRTFVCVFYFLPLGWFPYSVNELLSSN